MASPATAETDEIERFGLSLAAGPPVVQTGDVVTINVRVRPLDGNDDLYFLIDTGGLTVTGFTVAPGRLRCAYHDRLFCFVEGITAAEYLTLTATVAGPVARGEYIRITAGNFAGAVTRIAMRLTWQQLTYFPQVMNGTNRR